jgi:hypothetical protein
MICFRKLLVTGMILSFLPGASADHHLSHNIPVSNTVRSDPQLLASSPWHHSTRDQTAQAARSDRTYQFPVILATALDSSTSKVGDSVRARLAADVRNHGQLVAEKGSTLSGWVTIVDRPRKEIKSDVPGRHWLNANGAIGFVLTQMHTAGGKTYEFRASPEPLSEIHGINSSTPSYVVDKQGDLTVPYDGKAYGVMGAAVGGAALATGPVGLIIGPFLSGMAGAAKPAYAYDHPVSDSVHHRRLKGFFKGMVKGVPGGFLIAGVSNHGQNVRIPAGARLEIVAR